ncbi:Cytidine deaminase, homotetrameric [Syntrophomonas zehnderi OL-4]|uniref:Cytidine deaminase n=1 Tax=Syntrophomonas zehnderi OL-4 TaxID=690567 RepID=A0A0E4GF04_9FIRM|nr:cytidine deaminase [Syntrophomonas zehnderi]CFY00742.1 Cytidine deaminase, homotetrameric [Syntrophomonas zehnderi OL-4]
METAELISAARQASQNAYAPYSNFKVGAALLTKNGEIYTGANVENSSYGLTVCAERIAVFKAVTAGEKEFSSIAISASQKDYIFPCGACLQVLAEFSADIKVICTNAADNYKIYDLKDLFPQIFTL